MTPLEITGMTAGIIVSLGTILSMFGLGVRWLVKHYFDDIKHELKPNGGSSIKDQVNRMESKIAEAEKQRNETNKKIDHLYDVVIDLASKIR